MKYFREKSGMTQTEYSRAIRLSQAKVSKVEAGKEEVRASVYLRAQHLYLTKHRKSGDHI